MAQSPITMLATRHPILGKGGLDRQPAAPTAIQARVSASAKSAVPISSQRAFSLATGEVEIGSGTRIRKVSSMGDLNHDYFFWQENTFLLVDLFSGQHRWVNLKAGWDGSRQSKPAPANLGNFNMNQVTTKSVANMTTVERIAEAMKRAAYKAPDYFKQVILDMISPENLAIIMIFAAAQATPFGWVADAAAIISAVWAFRGRLEEIHVLGKAIADFIDLSLHAQTDTELDRAADDFVIIVTSGYDLLKLIITKRGGKLRQGEKRQVVTTRTNSGSSAPPPKAKAPDGPPATKAKKVEPKQKIVPDTDKKPVAQNAKVNTLKPGPYADKSIPARSTDQKFTKKERDQINKIGRETGCHTCGSKDPKSKSGNFVPDHQPPSQLLKRSEEQQLYPHCLNCSRKQGGQVSNIKRQQDRLAKDRALKNVRRTRNAKK